MVMPVAEQNRKLSNSQRKPVPSLLQSCIPKSHPRLLTAVYSANGVLTGGTFSAPMALSAAS